MDNNVKTSQVAQASGSTGTNTNTNYVTQYPDPHSAHDIRTHQEQSIKLSTVGSLSGANYLDYPTYKPFINSDYIRTDRPVNVFPESQRDAILSALRSLHEKIKKLEIERNMAEQNLQALASDTEQYRQLLKNGRLHKADGKHHSAATGAGDLTTRQSKDEGQLSSVEHRCQLLEKQLSLVRKMVEGSEQSRRELMDQMRNIQQNLGKPGSGMKLYMERLGELERDQRRLTGTQQLTEGKIRDLELRIRQEKNQLEKLQERTCQLESGSQDKKDKSSSPSHVAVTQVWKTSKPSTKKKKVLPKEHPSRSRKTEHMRHFRLNLADIPFVAGQSTGPSHALGANVQKVLAMLKMHNTILCSQMLTNGDCSCTESSSSARSSNGSVERDLSDLLIQLQDEFGELNSKHQDVMDKLHAAYGGQDKAKLEQELHELQKNLEVKSRQILKITQSQRKMENVKRSRSLSAKRTTTLRSSSTSNQPGRSVGDRVSRSKHYKCGKPLRNLSHERPELFMLRDVKKLQGKLQKEDIYWE